ncbi:hypothetical protein CHS0354_018836 [Potamilus streckersoni]|uniref:Uncharacterized protein n=1 Tax=Potamilus streckersoni TaxID=2493646 RepID=A0AAE0SIG2_9BIVA|nr:hypothetical protein CHS0354_018836 [Potamilus streckersoni]
MDWADSHLETANRNCISLIDLNQPISKEALKRFSSLSNSSSLNNTSSGSDNYSTTTTITDNSMDVSNTFNAEVMEELKALSCPLDCNSRGSCKNGIFSFHSKILQNGTKLLSDDQPHQAELINDSEVECILPQGDILAVAVARGYQVSVSNDGRLFSRETT